MGPFQFPQDAPRRRQHPRRVPPVVIIFGLVLPLPIVALIVVLVSHQPNSPMIEDLRQHRTLFVKLLVVDEEERFWDEKKLLTPNLSGTIGTMIDDSKRALEAKYGPRLRKLSELSPEMSHGFSKWENAAVLKARDICEAHFAKALAVHQEVDFRKCDRECQSAAAAMEHRFIKR